MEVVEIIINVYVNGYGHLRLGRWNWNFSANTVASERFDMKTLLASVINRSEPEKVFVVIILLQR